MSSKFLIALIAQDLNALFSRSDANVIIVRFLNYCGGYNPGYSGCSDDDLLIVVDNQYGLDTALARLCCTKGLMAGVPLFPDGPILQLP